MSCFEGSPPQTICTPTLVLTNFEYIHACLGPTERSEACSDEARDCKLHITQTNNCT